MEVRTGKRKRLKPGLNVAIWLLAFIALLVIAVMLFMGNYTQLEDSLAAERTVYISELSKQLVDKINKMQMHLFREVGLYAELLQMKQPETFEEAETLFATVEAEGDRRVFLVDGDGCVYRLDGKMEYLENAGFLSDLIFEGRQGQSFERNSVGEERWIFGSPVDLTIGERPIKAVLVAYDAKNFRSSFDMELFDQQGYSFLVDQNGAVVIGIQKEQRFGYNLLASFREIGMDGDILQGIKTDLAAGAEGRTYAQFDNATWLIQYALLDSATQYVFVLVPVSVTAELPFRFMNRTLFTGLLAIVSLMTIFLGVMLMTARSNRKKDAEVYQANLLAQSAQAKSDFMSRMSHDIRTPLNAVIGMNYIAEANLDNREKLENCHREIAFSANYLLELINDMLDMQKIESGKLTLNAEPFSLLELQKSVETINRTRMEEKGIHFAVRNSGFETWNYVGDKLRVSQVLMNLLSNAYKFTESGGAVVLEAAVQERRGKLDLVKLSVTDTGIGMSEEYLSHLGRPFEQESSDTASKHGGSGLGLSIVYNLVSLMGGTIEVKSEKGKGTAFTVLLPLERTEEAVPEHAAAAPREPMALTGKRVLLLEDNAINREIAAELLSMEGVSVETAEDGKIGLERFECSEPGYYQMVITDIRMPVMDGYEFARAMRALDREDARTIPIVAMSANAFDEDVKASLASGMNDHLRKPIVVEEVRAALQKYLGGTGGGNG